MGNIESEIVVDHIRPHTDAPATKNPASRGQTGPRFLSGKTICRENAVKHGIFSRELCISKPSCAEDPDDFREILAESRQTYLPLGRRQHWLVGRIAYFTWRLQRVERFEIGAIHRLIEAEENAPRPDTQALDQQIAHYDERVAGHRKALDALLHDPGADVTHIDRAQLLEDALIEVAMRHKLVVGNKPALAEVYQILSRFSQSPGRTPAQLREEALESLRSLLQREEGALAKLRGQREQVALDIEREGELRAEREWLLCALPPAHEANLVIRYETMLSRKIDRAIDALDALKRRGK